MKLVRRRQAVYDIDDHAAYIAEHDMCAAYRFLDRVEETALLKGPWEEGPRS